MKQSMKRTFIGLTMCAALLTGCSLGSVQSGVKVVPGVLHIESLAVVYDNPHFAQEDYTGLGSRATADWNTLLPYLREVTPGVMQRHGIVAGVYEEPASGPLQVKEPYALHLRVQSASPSAGVPGLFMRVQMVLLDTRTNRTLWMSTGGIVHGDMSKLDKDFAQQWVEKVASRIDDVANSPTSTPLQPKTSTPAKQSGVV
jgi:hypothetical protein